MRGTIPGHGHAVDATLTADNARPTGPAVDGIASDPTLAAHASGSPTPIPGLRRVARSEYERGAELARGGMGRIIAARDVRHDRPVAIKELLDRHPMLIARFEREA
ncbi:MAG: hypothetical protein K8W52_25735, partial [Deltaproteobacteria bacterium]|nr:hypothetical protein [Deltaproteobacteria bacterium]